jgi:hypothetical protein
MGRLPPGRTPAERRLKQGCVSRTAAAVAPVGRPHEALATVLGEDYERDDPIHGKPLARARRSSRLLMGASERQGAARRARAFRRLQHSRVDADYCCSADPGASRMTAARGGGATLSLSTPPHRVVPLARAGFQVAARMQRRYAAR